MAYVQSVSRRTLAASTLVVWPEWKRLPHFVPCLMEYPSACSGMSANPKKITFDYGLGNEWWPLN